ncbi:MAG: tRNA uridine-5-carboxymethylaminomethyl(34) synthesis GTPase MnmE [Spirochaetes bacterium]|nr:tRNA uridine-5-carboxymethylaminomethyl(34) synthesis GTPase MnmE [Spirochaetota bacterium]
MARSYLDIKADIAAPATAPGRAALAVVRLSGPGAIALCSPCFSGRRALSALPGYSLAQGFFVDPASGERIDQVVVSVFRTPHSFTGEDSVEFSCHGSPAVVLRVLSVLESQGFVPALPGEFSFRAFVNGKADLVQAEAINELSGAFCETARQDALARLSGLLSSRLAAIRTNCLDLLAGIEARLDYPEDEGPEDEGAVRAGLLEMESSLVELSEGYAGSRLRREGALVVLAGRPNAGKSSLFNILVREERAIVSPEPGTTRDWIEAWMELGGYALRLVDTAGLRAADGGIEAEGVRRSLGLAEIADILVYLVDGRQKLSAVDDDFLAPRAGVLKVWNKIDDPACSPVPPEWIGLSSKTGAGIQSLKKVFLSRLGSGLPDTAARREAQVGLAGERQKLLVDRALDSVRKALSSLELAATLDVLALEMREAASFLGEITGEILGDEVLERIFGSFCLGK